MKRSILSYTHACTHTCIHTYISPKSHYNSRGNILSHMHVCTHTRIYIYIYVCMYVYVHAYILPKSCQHHRGGSILSHTRVCTHTHTHIYICIYTYIHITEKPPSSSWFTRCCEALVRKPYTETNRRYIHFIRIVIKYYSSLSVYSALKRNGDTFTLLALLYNIRTHFQYTCIVPKMHTCMHA